MYGFSPQQVDVAFETHGPIRVSQGRHFRAHVWRQALPRPPCPPGKFFCEILAKLAETILLYLRAQEVTPHYALGHASDRPVRWVCTTASKFWFFGGTTRSSTTILGRNTRSAALSGLWTLFCRISRFEYEERSNADHALIV